MRRRSFLAALAGVLFAHERQPPIKPKRFVVRLNRKYEQTAGLRAPTMWTPVRTNIKRVEWEIAGNATPESFKSLKLSFMESTS